VTERTTKEIDEDELSDLWLCHRAHRALTATAQDSIHWFGGAEVDGKEGTKQWVESHLFWFSVFTTAVVAHRLNRALASEIGQLVSPEMIDRTRTKMLRELEYVLRRLGQRSCQFALRT